MEFLLNHSVKKLNLDASLGVPLSRVRVVSYGEERPAVRGSGESAWSKNRRAEFALER